MSKGVWWLVGNPGHILGFERLQSSWHTAIVLL